MGRTKKTSLFAFLLLLTAAFSANAQLPDSISGWVTTAFRPVAAAQLTQFAGEDAGVIWEYGFESGEHREYSKGGATLVVNLWKMRDASGGYGLYSFYREAGTAVSGSETRMAIWPNRLLVQHGPYVIDARGTRLTIGDSKLLLSKIPPISRRESVGTLLPAALPEDRMVPQTLKFILGPVAFAKIEKGLPAAQIGFESGAEAEIAEYQTETGGRNVRLLLVSYATPQLAAKKLREFQQTVKGQQEKGIYLDRRGSMIGLTFGAPTAEAGEALLRRIRQETQVTWSEYVPTRRDNVAHLVLNVFLLAGFVLLFALVAGLSFGGIRILTKRFSPVPVFDRPSQMEIIQLHLSGR
ncbi:MAG: hypothetical protein HYX72_03285 [Acidobacteria bacterium]|nr:hypothetical protein [Acidobacteriota bacterium]